MDVQYLENIHELHNDFPFLPKRMKNEKVENLVTNLHDKTEYVNHIRNLKQELIHELQTEYVNHIRNLKQALIHELHGFFCFFLRNTFSKAGSMFLKISSI